VPADQTTGWEERDARWRAWAEERDRRWEEFTEEQRRRADEFAEKLWRRADEAAEKLWQRADEVAEERWQRADEVAEKRWQEMRAYNDALLQRYARITEDQSAVIVEMNRRSEANFVALQSEIAEQRAEIREQTQALMRMLDRLPPYEG
jgi:hypothetical protein